MKTETPSRSEVAEQIELAPTAASIEKEETELQEVVRRTTMDALVTKDGITEKDVDRMLAARIRVIQTMRMLALKLTQPEDWTLWKDEEGHVIATPRASAMLRVRPWFNVSTFNHRSMSNEPGVATENIVEKGDKKIRVLEMQCDVRIGKDVLEGIPFSVRSDDKFIGRADRAERHGGPRFEDLMSCLRTGLDKKAFAMGIGFTKIPEAELIAAGHDTKRCYKGSGYGSSQDRQAGRVAEGGVKEAAQALWQEMLRCANGKIEDARTILKDCTKYNSFKGDNGDTVPAFPGLDSPDKFAKIEQVLKAAEKFKKHPTYVPPPAAAPREPGEEAAE